MSGRNFVARLVAGVQILLFTLIMFSGVPAAGKKGRQPETVYSNPTSIAINTATGLTAPTVAATYPSQIAVSGMAGNTTRVAVTLNGFNHLGISQLDFLLVSPTGAKFVFASDLTGLIFSAVDKVYTFTDDAAATFPTLSLLSGSFKPTSGDGFADTFPAPAPAGPYNVPSGSTFASSFNGVSPNGNWSLYVVDDTLGTGGNLYDGWSLNITTDSSPATAFANTSVINVNDINAAATPYGSTISVSGASGVISNLKVTLSGVSSTVPSDIDVLLVSPNGKSLVLMSDTGNGTASNANLTFDDAAVFTLEGSVVTGSYKPTDTTPEADTFNPPAPPRPYLSGTNNSLSSYNGYSPNGDWKLYVVDDTQNSSIASIAGGWSLDITTTAPVPPTPIGCTSPSFSVTNIPVGTGPTNVAVADFNNDGKPDLAVTNQISNDVSILAGNGAGGFSALASVTAGSGPYAIAAGKFNADANFDLAVVNSSSNNVSILLGNGNGTFSAPTNFFVGVSPISIAVADFNSDTKQDLAVANFGGFFNGTVSMLMGNGTGGFTAGNSVRARTQPAFVAAADFNSDSKQDLVVANFGSNNTSVYFGDGLGTFPVTQSVSNTTGPVAIEVANYLGNDAFPDLAIAHFNADSVTGYTGSASGTFTFASNVNIGSNPVSITSGDFNQDGSIVLAVALNGANSVKIGGNTVPVGLNPNAVEAGLFNADSKPDIVAVNSGSNDISVMLNICQVATGNLMDFNGDRRTDIMVYRPSNNGWWSNPSPTAFVFARPNDKTVPADYDGDHITDYAIYRPETNQWYVVDRLGRPLYFLTFGVAGDIPAPGDFDGDGKADIAVFRPSNGNWYIRLSTDNLTTVATWGMNGDVPVAADYDGDGKDDIAVFRPSTGVWYVFRSSDSQAAITQWGMNGDKTVAGDYDGDGKADLAIWRPSDGAWYALRSSNGGVQAYYWGQTGDYPQVGDFDGDGKYDFAVWRPTDQIWYVLRSSDLTPSYTQWGISADYPVPNSFVR